MSKDGEFLLPGGGFEKGETPVECAIREAQEEVRFNVKNARETGYDYIELNDKYEPWVIRNVQKDRRWKHYYTCLVIAELASNYNGDIDEVDLDPEMDETKK